MSDGNRPAEVVRVAQVIGKLSAAGVEGVINNYYRNIDHKRYQFDYYIDEDSTVSPPQELIDLGARYYVIPPYSKLFSYLPALTKAFREHGYTIVHSNMNTLSVFSLFAAWRAGVPVRICHSHSTAAPGETRRNILKYMLRPFSKWFATDLLACSEYAGTWLYGRRAMARGKVKLLNNAIDLKDFAYDPERRTRLRDALGLRDQFVMGHVGRFCFQKNHAFLIDIFADVHRRCPDSVLLLVGDGPLRAEMQGKVEALGLGDSVLFLGIRKDVRDLYQAMDVFVLPSHYEGLPVVGVEAQAAGLPCVFSENITREAIILPETKALALTEGVTAWADAIISFRDFDRADTTEVLRRKGFDIASEAPRLTACYDEAIKRRHKREART